MGRIAELVGQKPNRPGPKCRITVILDTYPDAERAEWVELMADPSLQHAQITRAFKADGHQVTQCSVGRHRKGDCACG